MRRFSGFMYWLRTHIKFTCPCTDGRRIVVSLIPYYGSHSIGTSLPTILQKCVMWDYYYWYPGDDDLLGYCDDKTYSIGIPFTKYTI